MEIKKSGFLFFASAHISCYTTLNNILLLFLKGSYY